MMNNKRNLKKEELNNLADDLTRSQFLHLQFTLLSKHRLLLGDHRRPVLQLLTKQLPSLAYHYN